MSGPSKDQLKQRSKHLSQLLQEKYGLKVSHGHCLDVVSKLFGFADWNTASAAKEREKPDLAMPRTIGALIVALQAYSPDQSLSVLHEEVLDVEVDYENDGTPTLAAPERIERRKYSLVVTTNDDGSCGLGLINVISLPEITDPKVIASSKSKGLGSQTKPFPPDTVGRMIERLSSYDPNAKVEFCRDHLQQKSSGDPELKRIDYTSDYEFADGTSGGEKVLNVILPQWTEWDDSYVTPVTTKGDKK